MFFVSFGFKSGWTQCSSVPACVCVVVSWQACVLQLAGQGQAQSCKRWGPQSSEPRDKSPALSKRQHWLWHAYPLTEREACMCVCFPVCWIHPWLHSTADLFGSPQQTSTDIRGRLPTKPSLFQSSYFHLISHQYEMRSYERAQFTVRWVGVFKKNTLIDAVPLMLGEELVVAAICWPVLFQRAPLKGQSVKSKRIYSFMVSVCF